MWKIFLVAGFAVGFSLVWLIHSLRRKHREEVLSLFSQLLQRKDSDTIWFVTALLGDNRTGNDAANAFLRTSVDVKRMAGMLQPSLDRDRWITTQCEGGLRYGDTHRVAIPLLRLILAMVEHGNDTPARKALVNQVFFGIQVGLDAEHRNNTKLEWRNHAFRVLIAADTFCVAAFQGFLEAADEETVLMGIPFFIAQGEKAEPFLRLIANSDRYPTQIRSLALSGLATAAKAVQYA